MDGIEGRIAAVARGQLGLVTRACCMELGMSRHQVDRRVRRGLWVRVHPGVFAFAGAPASHEQRVLAAVLAAGGGAVASHATAARLHALMHVPEPNGIEITVTTGHVPVLDGVTAHRTGVLPEADRARVGPIPVTSVARTIADCARGLSLGQLARSHWVVVRGERFRLDLAYPDRRLGLEYLGFDPHRSRGSFDRDFRRDRLLKGVGWDLVYFTGGSTERDVLETLATLVG